MLEPATKPRINHDLFHTFGFRSGTLVIHQKGFPRIMESVRQMDDGTSHIAFVDERCGVVVASNRWKISTVHHSHSSDGFCRWGCVCLYPRIESGTFCVMGLECHTQVCGWFCLSDVIFDRGSSNVKVNQWCCLTNNSEKHVINKNNKIVSFLLDRRSLSPQPKKNLQWCLLFRL